MNFRYIFKNLFTSPNILIKEILVDIKIVMEKQSQ